MSTITSLDPQITMRELLQLYPGAQRALFRRYHIGGCASCGFQPDETLEGVCARNESLSVPDVIDHIVASHEQDAKMQISPVELAGALQSDPEARLLDVRTREEFDTVHVPGSVFFNQELMQEILMKWDRRTLLALMDHQGTRSMHAAAYFVGHGFENARSVRGGIDAWSQEVDQNLPRYDIA